MASSLLSLADNLPEGLQKGKCKDFESRLEYMTAKDVYNLMKNYLRDSKTHISSVREALTNFFHVAKKVFIHMNTQMAGKDSMKHYL